MALGSFEEKTIAHRISGCGTKRLSYKTLFITFLEHNQMSVYHLSVRRLLAAGRGLVIALNNNWTTHDIRAPVAQEIFIRN